MAALFGIWPEYPGYASASSVITPMPTEWWLRPVSSAARVGEQSAVVWKRVYRKPFFASRSRFGVGIWPPNVLHCPNPASSIRMSRTLGAPSGALTMGILSGFDALYVSPITPWNGASGRGRVDAAAPLPPASPAAGVVWFPV